MSDSISDDAVARLLRVRTGFNTIFKTKLEIDAKKLKKELAIKPEDKTPPGDLSFSKRYTALEARVEAKVGKRPNPIIKLGPMVLEYWCDLPARIAAEFEKDAAFDKRINAKLDANTDKLVDLWAKALVHYERLAVEATAKGNSAAVAKATVSFAKDAKTLQRECEEASTELIVAEFTVTIKAMANHTRYKVKAGAKLSVSVVGLVAAIVALGTAATPAAPATLIPAAAGIGAGILSIGKQIGDLAMSVEECELEISSNLDKWKAEYLDEHGKRKKMQFKAQEFMGGVLGGLTGGASEWVFPTIKGTLDIVERHARKLDGLVTRTHELGIRLTSASEELKVAIELLEQNEHAASTPEHGSKQWEKFKKDCAKAIVAVTVLENEIEKLNLKIPKLEKRIEHGRTVNEDMKRGLLAVQSALGTKNYALAGQLLSSVALAASGGAGMAAGGGSHAGLSEAAKAALEFKEHIDKIDTSIAIGMAGLDIVREYTEEVVERLL